METVVLKHKKNVIEIVREYSERIKDGRSRQDIMGCCVEELGEVATEIKIAEGRSYKEAGPDGIVGEYIDLIAGALDGIHKEDPTMTYEEFVGYLVLKCIKWETKVNERLTKERYNE